MSQKCANPKCDKEVKSTPGKRPKKYCSPRCTSAHWQALHYKPKKDYVKVPMNEWLEMFCKLNEVTEEEGKRKFFEYKSTGEAGIIEVPSAAAGKPVTVTITAASHFKPQEVTKIKKQGNDTKKEEAAVNGAENASKLTFVKPPDKKEKSFFDEWDAAIKQMKIRPLGDKVNFKEATDAHFDGVEANRILHDEPSQWQEPVVDKEAIEKQIKAIQSEKIPDHRNTTFGKKSWLLDQQKRINELKNKL